ncbi:MAG: hypothetical protein ACPG61_17370, partial [Paracoccaceae bacterium]
PAFATFRPNLGSTEFLKFAQGIENSRHFQIPQIWHRFATPEFTALKFPCLRHRPARMRLDDVSQPEHNPARSGIKETRT